MIIHYLFMNSTTLVTTVNPMGPFLIYTLHKSYMCQNLGNTFALYVSKLGEHVCIICVKTWGTCLHYMYQNLGNMFALYVSKLGEHVCIICVKTWGTCLHYMCQNLGNIFALYVSKLGEHVCIICVKTWGTCLHYMCLKNLGDMILALPCGPLRYNSMQ
jgi:hypothetical protein